MKKISFDKVWDSHVVQQVEDGPDILFIDRHMVHEVTSPVAFLGLKPQYPGFVSRAHLCHCRPQHPYH